MNTDLILANIAKHISLTDDEVDFFTSILQPRFVKRREHLYKSGQTCMHESFVTKGCLRTYYIDTEGVERILSFATENDWTGDPRCFWTQKPSAFNIEALEVTELIQIERSDLERLFKRVSKFKRYYADKFMKMDLYVDTWLDFLALLPQDAKLLELGCGPGNVIRFFLDKRSDLKITGLDLAPKMI